MDSEREEYDEARRLLAPLAGEPAAPSRVDIGRAMATGRRRIRTRRMAGVGAVAAVAALAAAGVPAVLDVAAGPADPPPPPAATGPVTPSPTASPTPAPLSECVVERLPVPGDASQSLVTGGDPTGRFLLGRSYFDAGPGEGNIIPGVRLEMLIWDRGEPTVIEMPGWDAALDDINSHGVAVGSSFRSSDVDDLQTGWVYTGGELRELAGGAVVPHAINEQGAIAGSRQLDVTVQRPVVWRSPEAEPEELSVPGESWTVRATDVDADGTVVGTGHDWDLVPDAPSYSFVWLPEGTRQQLPLPPADGRAGEAIGFAASSIRDGIVTGQATHQRGSQTTSSIYQYHLATGEFTAVSDDTVAGRVWAQTWNATGWLAGNAYAEGVVPGGHFVLWHSSTGALALPGLLPGVDVPDSAAYLAGHLVSVSEDGRVVGGQLSTDWELVPDTDYARGADQVAVAWHCA